MNEASLVSLVPLVFQETGVLQGPLALDLKDLQERKVSRVSQEDLDLPVHLVKGNFLFKSVL